MSDIELKKKWVAGLDAALKDHQVAARREEEKQALLAVLQGSLGRDRDELVEGTHQKVVDERGRKKKQKTVDDKHHDATKEFDVYEQADGYRLANAFGKLEEWDPKTGTQEQFQKLQQAYRKLDGLVAELESAQSDRLDEDGNPVPLFTEEEISATVYQPMIRLGLIPETAVPQKYSQTQKMLDGAFSAYAERLKKDKKGIGRRLFEENFNLVKAIGTGAMTMAGSAAKLDASGDMSNAEQATSGAPADNIKSIKQGLGELARDDGSAATTAMVNAVRLDFTNQAISFALDTGYEGAKDVVDKVSSVQAAGAERARMAGLVGGIVMVSSGALGSAFAASGLGLDLSTTFGVTLKQDALLQKLKDKDAAGAGDLLGQAGYDTLLALDPGVDDSAAKMAQAAKAWLAAYRKGLNAKAAAKALDADRHEEAAKAFTEAAEAAAEAAAGVDGLLALLGRGDVGDKVMDKAARAVEAAFRDSDGPQPSPKDIAAHDKITDHDPSWTLHEGRVVCEHCLLADDEDAKLFTGLIEKKIARLKNDQAIVKWSTTLVGLSIDTAANFIAPLAIAGCAIKMAKNCYEAGKRARDLDAFIEKQQGLFNAASAFSPVVSQFIYNSGLQTTHYAANACFEAAKMIGAIVQCSGAMAAPAGVAVSAGASIAQALEQILYEAKKRLDLETAWNLYLRALSRPECRKDGLIAAKENPTLAKYAIAWGAVVQKSNLVGDFVGAVGLTPESLKDPAADVHKVVEYLEARLPDDNVVVGRTVDGPPIGWGPPSIELTVDSWLLVKKRAVEVGKVLPQDTLALESALVTFGRLEPEVRGKATSKPPTLTVAEADALLALLKELDSLLARVDPRSSVDESGKAAKEGKRVISIEMDDIRTRLQAKALACQRQVQAWREAAVARAARATA